MITIFPLPKIIKFIGYVYVVSAALAIALIWKYTESATVLKSLTTASAIAALMSIGLWTASVFLWRWLWKRLPFLNKSVFPDLNGRWEMRINYTIPDEKSGALLDKSAFVDAYITQSLFTLSIVGHSKDSSSETLSVQPMKDPTSNILKLYYVFRVTPRKTDKNQGDAYLGAAILTLSDTDPSYFGGNYFTDRRTIGHYHLTRK
jgi:hypothetical protein